MPRPDLEWRQACMAGRGKAKAPCDSCCVICAHSSGQDVQNPFAISQTRRQKGPARVPSMQQAKMEPAGFFRRIPLLPHQMQARLTPTADMIVLCHLGIPRLDREAWSLKIDGMVERPTQIDFSQLTTYPKHTVTSFHQCAGSPLQPLEPTQRICNVRWGGARLADVLRDCGPALKCALRLVLGSGLRGLWRDRACGLCQGHPDRARACRRAHRL